MTRRLAWLFLLAVAACTEEATAPADCPNFCPGGQIVVLDTIFTDIIVKDSAFNGYVAGHQALAATAADLPGVKSRPFFLLKAMITRRQLRVTDTTTVPIAIDSARLRVSIVRRDKNATNLRLRLFTLPLTVDSTSTFADLDSYFSAPVVDSVNVSALLARQAIGDTATIRAWGDSIRTDSAGHVLQISRSDSALHIFFSLDTLQAPFSVPDSGKLAFGVEVAADSLASIGIGTNESVGNGAVMHWFYHFTVPDTLPGPDSTAHDSLARAPSLDSFVFSPPTAALDSNLAVGGVPSARSLLRVAIPAFLHDSIDVVRATAILVPVAAVPGVAIDSFTILARPVLTDLGGKSPLGANTADFAHVVIHPGSTDTVRIEITNMVRTWVADTTRPRAFFLGQVPEATSFTEIRFYSSRTPAFRPALQVTYVKRFPFGAP